MGEVEDARAAVDWLHAEHSGSPLWLAGFSFGCYAGLRAMRDDKRVQRLFAVAPAVGFYSFSFMAGDERPLRVIYGLDDEIVEPDAIRHWAESLPTASSFPIEGAGHFFAGRMEEMMAALLGQIN